MLPLLSDSMTGIATHAAPHQGILFFHQLQVVQIVLTALVDLVDLKSLSLPPFQVHLWLPSHPLAQETPSRLCLPFSLQIHGFTQCNIVPTETRYFNIMHFLTKNPTSYNSHRDSPLFFAL